MPRISAFYGVVIYMYWNERDHPVAHLHAYHAGRRTSVAVDGTVLAGSLEPRALQFVREWAGLHVSESSWQLASAKLLRQRGSGRPPETCAALPAEQSRAH